jgi:hypothetical protein
MSNYLNEDLHLHNCNLDSLISYDLLSMNQSQKILNPSQKLTPIALS